MPAKHADSLKEYRRRRDFAKTSEPAGGEARAGGRSFVVQKHDATRLHYDFRLELDGVLKSWAVTKGPSLNPADKRLAVRTEDHPLEYGGFEGTIPKGEYGGGTVMLWDRGTWAPIEDPHEGLKKGKLTFRLEGERMKGAWALIRMKPRSKKEKRENWLLVKERDSEADGHDIDTDGRSVASGRTMAAIAEGTEVWHSNRKKGAAKPRRAKPGKERPLPDFHAPQLATLTDAPPEGDDWVHELKYDGYRLIVAASGATSRCYTRSGQDWTSKFPAVAKAFSAMSLDGALIDGEAVAYADGRSSFSALQKALSEGGRIEFYAFDLLENAGEDLRPLPLTQRKARLKTLLADLPKSSPIHFSTHIEGRGSEVFARVCEAKEEGIVSKVSSAPYRSERTKNWLKVKCTKRQEFVIGGWTPSDKRTGFRSLLLGANEDGKLRYVGRVGTGFDEELLTSLSKKLKSLARQISPFEEVPRDARRQAKWTEPELVAEIAFTEFTGDGILRHPAFLGLREDKKARDVEIERGEPIEKVMGEVVGTKSGGGSRGGGSRAGVRITSPDKVLFPDQGLTKADLLDYYEVVAEFMLPHLKGRPLSLVRCPQGRAKKCFFQKHDSGGFPEELKRVEIKEGTGASGQYFYVDNFKGIVAGVQMGVLEFHVWGSRVDNLEKPDRIVFDLDPDEGLDFEAVRAAAFDVRDRLADIGLETFAMLSGGKGFHVIAPLERRAEWPEVKAFCRAFAVMLGEDAPDRYVANMSKAKRKGRIFVDYLRNERGSTSIAPYSTRARAGAAVATPITWKEAKTVKAANIFGVATMSKRVAERGDVWPGYFDVRQSITKAMLAAVG